jgi:hypothetical protein
MSDLVGTIIGGILSLVGSFGALFLRGMSSEVIIALIGVVGTLIGTLGGTLGGIWFAHWLRTRGDVRCVLGRTDAKATRLDNEGAIQERGVDVTRPGVLERVLERLSNRGGEVEVHHSLELRFFNEKDEATGLSEVSVAFIGKNAREVVLNRNSRAFRALTGQPAGPTANTTMDVVNLPAQTWVGMSFEGIHCGEDVAQLLAWERMEVRAKFPNGRQFRKIVRER